MDPIILTPYLRYQTTVLPSYTSTLQINMDKLLVWKFEQPLATKFKYSMENKCGVIVT
jgi:hypothetical protein